MPDFPQSPFWAFSLAVYGQAGIPASCLDMQERHGLDVNILLAALWAGSAGRRLSDAEWDRLEGTVAAFHRDVVRPLRTARRALKPAAEAALPASPLTAGIRQAVKRAELDAEHLEQLMIEAELGPLPSGPPIAASGGEDAGRANILAYLARLGRAVESADEAAIEALLRAAARAGDSVGG